MAENNQEKQYRIFLKSTQQWVPVSKTDFDNYYRDINTFRRKQQEHGRCVCLRSKWWLCDMDCYTCPYHKGGDTLSLDYTVTDGEGNEKSWLDDLPDDAPGAESVLEERELLDALYRRLDELDPDGRRICELVKRGCSERDSAAELGLSRNTYVYRRDKLLAALSEFLKEFI
jgi:DNA-directed RNA polymerase specialized sigma24 family protein